MGPEMYFHPEIVDTCWSRGLQ
jgi:actin-related protein